MILTRKDILQAKELGLIHVADAGEVGATSIDVRVGMLYKLRLKEEKIDTSKFVDMPYDQFKKECLVEVPLIGDSFWLLEPNNHYIAETIEKVFLSTDFIAEVNSRSSWGRYGVRVSQCIDEIGRLGRAFEGTIPLSISTYGAPVMLRPGDAPAQLTFAYIIRTQLFDDALMAALKNDEVILERDGKKVEADDIRIKKGIMLTLDKNIKIYKGGVIDPRKPVDALFDNVELSDKGMIINSGQFFISSSAERVRIGKKYVGWVNETNYFSDNDFAALGPTGISTIRTHPNAPKIDPYPRFDGKITFENQPHMDVILKPGQRLTELQLCPLLSPYEHMERQTSRYKGQDSATASRGHLDK